MNNSTCEFIECDYNYSTQTDVIHYITWFVNTSFVEYNAMCNGVDPETTVVMWI